MWEKAKELAGGLFIDIYKLRMLSSLLSLFIPALISNLKPSKMASRKFIKILGMVIYKREDLHIISGSSLTLDKLQKLLYWLQAASWVVYMRTVNIYYKMSLQFEKLRDWCLTLSPGKLKRDVLAGSAINSMEWNEHMNECGLLFPVLIFWVGYIHNEESSQAQVVWKVLHLTGQVDKVRAGQQQSECCKSLTSRSDVVYIKE